MAPEHFSEAILIFLQMHVQNGTIIADACEPTDLLVEHGLIRASKSAHFGSNVYVLTETGKTLSVDVTEAGIICS